MSQTTLIQPYLFFGGRCEEAIAFYREAMGAELEMMMRYSESPQPAPPGRLPPGFENKVMHAQIKIGDAIIMLSDGCFAKTEFVGFSLSLAFADAAQVDRAFAGLSKGGKVTMPLGETFWSPRFGMVEDKLGVEWMLSVIPA